MLLAHTVKVVNTKCNWQVDRSTVVRGYSISLVTCVNGMAIHRGMTQLLRVY